MSKSVFQGDLFRILRTVELAARHFVKVKGLCRSENTHVRSDGKVSEGFPDWSGEFPRIAQRMWVEQSK